MSSCLIIGASDNVYWDGRADCGLIICADGGIKNALKLNLKPDICIGDGDSADISSYVGEVIILPAEKDYSDMEACLREALRRGFDEIYISGCTGGRQDHFVSGLFLLEYAHKSGAAAVILDVQNEITLFERCFVLYPPHSRKYFSLLSLEPQVYGVTIENAKYPLNNHTLHRASSLGLSNEALPGKAVVISAGAGVLCLIKSD